MDRHCETRTVGEAQLAGGLQQGLVSVRGGNRLLGAARSNDAAILACFRSNIRRLLSLIHVESMSVCL